MVRKLCLVLVVSAMFTGTVMGSAASASAASVPANRFAVVDAAGNLIHGGGVTGVTHLGTGQYEVTFSSNVNACAYVATPASTLLDASQAFTARGRTTRGVRVDIRDQNALLRNGPFDLLVVDCSTFSMLFAVIGYSSNLVRSTPGTSLDPLGFGRYNVRFGGNISRCSYLASGGDPGNGVAPGGSGVYTGSGSGNRTVYIETKNNAGGLQGGIPFHLAVICPTAPRVLTAVVEPDGTLSRGSPRITSHRDATGQYSLDTVRNVSTCAVLGTRGSFNTDVPFNPATVEIGPQPAANAVSIKVRNLEFFGGGYFDEAFHSAIVC